jgi:hypothetical protein
MNPAEAAMIEFEEPDWVEEFNLECQRWPRLPRYLREESAFPEIMRRWRRFHSTPVEVDGEWKRRPAPAVEAIVALAKLKVMPPRSGWNDIPRDDETGYQQDDHCWMSYAGEQWHIIGIEDRTLFLERMWFEEKQRETKQIDLNRANWTNYLESAVAVLEAMESRNGNIPSTGFARADEG